MSNVISFELSSTNFTFRHMYWHAKIVLRCL